MKEDESEGDTKEDEEGFLLKSDDELVSYYSKNRVKTFFKKPMSGNFRNNMDKKPMSNVGGS